MQLGVRKTFEIKNPLVFTPVLGKQYELVIDVNVWTMGERGGASLTLNEVPVDSDDSPGMDNAKFNKKKIDGNS